MANFGMIDFKLGLYIKVNVNAVAINWHKIGQMPLFWQEH